MKGKFVIILVLMLSVSALAVYGQSNAALAGRYDITAMEIDGVDLLEFFEMMDISLDTMYIELLSNGKFRMAMDQENSVEGTYKLDGKNLKLISDQEDLDSIIEGNKIIIEQHGDEDSGFELSRMIFEKK